VRPSSLHGGDVPESRQKRSPPSAKNRKVGVAIKFIRFLGCAYEVNNPASELIIDNPVLISSNANLMSASLKYRLFCILVSGLIAFSCGSVAAVQLVSASGSSFPGKLGGSGDSGLSIISKEGHYVLFASTANTGPIIFKIALFILM
jgi:hypothetical protein